MGLYTVCGINPPCSMDMKSAISRAFVFVNPCGMGLVFSATNLNLVLQLVICADGGSSH